MDWKKKHEEQQVHEGTVRSASQTVLCASQTTLFTLRLLWEWVEPFGEKNTAIALLVGMSSKFPGSAKLTSASCSMFRRLGNLATLGLVRCRFETTTFLRHSGTLNLLPGIVVLDVGVQMRVSPHKNTCPADCHTLWNHHQVA